MLADYIDTLRQSTTNLINAFPSIITILRRTATDDGQGGASLSDLVPQRTLKVFFAGRVLNRGIVLLEHGETGQRWQDRYIVVAEHDADIQQGDEFVHNGHQYTVDDVFTDTAYQRKCEVREVPLSD